MNFRCEFVLSLTCFLVLSFPIYAQPLVNLQPGLDLFDAKKYSKAQEFFQELSREHSESAAIAYHLGRSYYQSRQIKNAVESLERAVELEEKNAEYHYLLGLAYASYVIEVGMFKRMGVAKKMKNEWVTAASIDANHKNARIALIGFYLNAPGIAGGSLEEGAKQLAILKQKYPDEVFPEEGQLLLKKEQYVEAEKYYRLAVKKNKSPRNLFSLASFLYQIKRYDEAEMMFKEYVTLDLSWNDPTKAYALFMLGNIFADKKMNAEANESFKLAKADNNDKLLDELIQRRMKELN